MAISIFPSFVSLLRHCLRDRDTNTLLTHLSFQMTGAEVVGDAV